MNRKIVIRRYHLNHRIKAGQGRFRIAFLTDLHNCTKDGDGERIMALLEKCRPDLVLVGGDMLVGKVHGEIQPAIQFMKCLAEKYTVFYANGNHEQRISRNPEKYGDMGEKYDHEIAKTKAVRLINQRADLELQGIPVTVYGFEPDEHYYDKGFRKKGMVEELEKTFGKPEPDRYTILLSHTPAYGREYLQWGADLTLSGHYHGGVVLLGKKRGLATPDFHIFSEYCCGIRSSNTFSMIVSAGLGEHSVPVRIFNPRELTIVDVK